jgi:quercetin dioxygenase-like cupin family protein
MTRRILVAVAMTVASAMLLPCAERAQDIVKVAPEHSKVLMENDDVRVVQTTLAPGQKDPLHTHPTGWYYVVKPGKMKIKFPDGKEAMWESETGEGAWLKTKSPHEDENVGNTTIIWVLVEVKSAGKTRPKME